MADELKSRAIEVALCPLCGFPPEYCEFGPNFKKCRARLAEEEPELLKQIEADQEKDRETRGQAHADKQQAKADKKEALAGDDADDNNNADAADADADDAKADLKPKKRGVSFKKEKEVVIKVDARGRRKKITTVTGVDEFGLSLKKVAKALSKKFACSAAAKKGM
jgi:density-regulated protein